VRSQHGVVTRRQLLELGFSRDAIDHRIVTRRLHQVTAGVYAVGRPDLTGYGRWMAAVLLCGPQAALSHGSAAAFWRIGEESGGKIHVSVRSASPKRRPELVVHRRPTLRADAVTKRYGIPVTTPGQTLIDNAVGSTRDEIERAVSEADTLGLIAVKALRADLEEHRGEPGVGVLRGVIDRRTFRASRSWLERRFLPLVRRAGYPLPQTRQWVNGFEVDFYWPGLGFVVETDGGQFHRTPFQQSQDRRRDQAHTAAGLLHLRFTHGQIRYEPAHVLQVMAETRRLLPAPGAVDRAA
jgi:very-short-patch-repair endonuclease